MKLGFVEESTLGEALTEATGVPYASHEKLRALAEDVQQVVPVEQLEKHRVCPFQLDGRTLRIAMLNPRDAVAIREIEQATGLTVEPWVTSEYRLYQALERHFRIRPEGVRALSLAPPAEMRRHRLGSPDESVPVRPQKPLETQPQVGLDGLPLDAEVDFQGHPLSARSEAPNPSGEVAAHPAPPNTTPPASAAVPSPGMGPPAGGAAPGPAVAPAAPQPSAPEPEAPLADPLARLDDALSTAGSRDEIARALLEFCSRLARRVALFAVAKGTIRGIAGTGRWLDDLTLQGITVPEDDATILGTGLQSKDFYFGGVPAVPANRDLYSVLGGRIPPTALLLPLRVKSRTVALLYMDNDDGPLERPDLPVLKRVAAKAGLAFEILILRNKLGQI